MDNDKNQPQPQSPQATSGTSLQNPEVKATNPSQEPDFLKPPSSYLQKDPIEPTPTQNESITKPSDAKPDPVAAQAPYSPEALETPPVQSSYQPSNFQAEPAVQVSQTESASNPPPNNRSGLLKRVLKILLGLVVVVVILGLIFMLVQRFIGGNTVVTLTYWGLWEDPKIMQSTISDFERQNPNIKIEYSNQDVKQYRDRLVTRISGGTGPDVFRLHNSWTTMLSPVLLPIPPNVISKSQFESDFYPVASSDLIKKGAIYAIPLEIDTLAMYVNTQLFQNAGISPPTNWNEFIDAARALTVKDQDGKIKTAGAAIGTYDNISHAPDLISLLFLQNSVDLRDLTTYKERVDGALNFYTSFATDQDNVWDNTLDPSILAFAKGNLGMYFGYSWDFFEIKQFNPDLAFQILPVPQLPNQTVNLASYWAEGVSVKTKHQKEALQFMKYLSLKETEQKLYTEQSKVRTFGEPYGRVDLADILKNNPIVYPFVSQASTAQSSYFIDSTYDNALNQQANTYLGNAVNSIINSTSPESAFEDLVKGITQVLEKYGW